MEKMICFGVSYICILTHIHGGHSGASHPMVPCRGAEAFAGCRWISVLAQGPCIRKNCPACARGEGHSSYALYGRREGKRFSI